MQLVTRLDRVERWVEHVSRIARTYKDARGCLCLKGALQFCVVHAQRVAERSRILNGRLIGCNRKHARTASMHANEQSLPRVTSSQEESKERNVFMHSMCSPRIKSTADRKEPLTVDHVLQLCSAQKVIFYLSFLVLNFF